MIALFRSKYTDLVESKLGLMDTVYDIGLHNFHRKVVANRHIKRLVTSIKLAFTRSAADGR